MSLYNIIKKNRFPSNPNTYSQYSQRYLQIPNLHFQFTYRKVRENWYDPKILFPKFVIWVTRTCFVFLDVLYFSE